MTSNIKCPFCQQELYQDYTGVMYCCNEDCEQSADWYGSPILWQALIESHKSLVLSEQSADREIHRLRDLLSQSQKDLEIATKALESIVSDYEVDASNGWLAANAKKALEQIKKLCPEDGEPVILKKDF